LWDLCFERKAAQSTKHEDEYSFHLLVFLWLT
jgi:hypothetical protein